jgi:hypothetical protein
MALAIVPILSVLSAQSLAAIRASLARRLVTYKEHAPYIRDLQPKFFEWWEDSHKVHL